MCRHEALLWHLRPVVVAILVKYPAAELAYNCGRCGVCGKFVELSCDRHVWQARTAATAEALAAARGLRFAPARGRRKKRKGCAA